jgi:NADH:ubiquinone oxidoreductase subunit E
VITAPFPNTSQTARVLGIPSRKAQRAKTFYSMLVRRDSQGRIVVQGLVLRKNTPTKVTSRRKLGKIAVHRINHKKSTPAKVISYKKPVEGHAKHSRAVSKKK